MKKNITYCILTILVVGAACTKSEPTVADSNTFAPLSIEFDNIAGGKNLHLNTVTYKNKSNETFTVSLLQYFVSNIQLTKTDGSIYKLPQDSSYYLVKEHDPATRKVKLKVPAAEYTKLEFLLGVDSLRSTMDIADRKGVLDPAEGMDEGMYWGWNPGYIFFKMEGISAAAPVDPSGQHKYRYHIGGFGGYTAPTINNIKTIRIDLSKAGVAKVRPGREANIHLMVDIQKVFDGVHTISIAENPSVMFSPFSVNIANNYQDMFTHDHTEN